MVAINPKFYDRSKYAYHKTRATYFAIVQLKAKTTMKKQRNETPELVREKEKNITSIEPNHLMKREKKYSIHSSDAQIYLLNDLCNASTELLTAIIVFHSLG